MKQMGEGGFFLIFRDKTFAGGRDLCYKFTFIVLILTPLILKKVPKIPYLVHLFHFYKRKKIEENPQFLPLVSTHRQLFPLLRLFQGLKARK